MAPMLIPLETPEILTTPYSAAAAWTNPLTIREISDLAPLPEKLRMATPERISEYLAGRFCAAKAIQACRPGTSIQVGMNPDGSPKWPDGLVGSITHTQGFAMAAVAPSDQWLGIGIDSEKMTESDILATAKHIVLSTDEERLGAGLPMPEDQFFRLAFSAKESIYKCLSPHCKQPIDYSTVMLCDVHMQSRTFYFQVSDSIKPLFLNSTNALGHFAFQHGSVHTAVELQRPLRAGEEQREGDESIKTAAILLDEGIPRNVSKGRV